MDQHPRTRKLNVGTVICGVDASSDASSAAHMAAALAARVGLRLVLARVVELRPGEKSDVAKRRVEDAESELIELADQLPSATVEMRIDFGRRAEVLAQVAAEEGADLIVLGSRSRRLRDRSLLCSLARELEVETPVPVLIAPPQTRRRSALRLAVAAAGAR
jgi:nucleotide-binding universal stress UspA family protein